jgi:hypothetical protein
MLAGEDAMNWSLYSADRSTHLKIVVVGLSTALLICVFGVAATEFNHDADIMTAQATTVIKVGAPMVFTERGDPVVR